jgi:predicted nuclease of predicted toxin-antitoxin system
VKILVDMNLSPAWVEALQAAGHEAVHWSTVGDPRAADETLMTWACSRGHVVLTHDLDFGALLAASRAGGPSVLQVRTQDVTVAALGPTVIRALWQYRDYLESGALVTVDESRVRARILPLTR